jgi:ribosome-binding protein aMBF1 (putative translation factor)
MGVIEVKGTDIRNAREGRQLSQQELAAHAGISQQDVARIERDFVQNGEKKRKVMEVLGLAW